MFNLTILKGYRYEYDYKLLIYSVVIYVKKLLNVFQKAQ